MSYRDDLEAAMQRMNALERELEDTRQQHSGDAERIEQLERSLELARRTIDNLNRGYAGGQSYAPPYPPPLPASNATTVLVFGILSLTVCALFGPFAWYYGSAEIRKMDYGMVDPSQRGSAVAGKVCGIIGTVLLILSFFFIFTAMASVSTL